jgi:hypothetical protein
MTEYLLRRETGLIGLQPPFCHGNVFVREWVRHVTQVISVLVEDLHGLACLRNDLGLPVVDDNVWHHIPPSQCSRQLT